MSISFFLYSGQIFSSRFFMDIAALEIFAPAGLSARSTLNNPCL